MAKLNKMEITAIAEDIISKIKVNKAPIISLLNIYLSILSLKNLCKLIWSCIIVDECDSFKANVHQL